MKVLALLAGFAVLFAVTGCEEEHEHHHYHEGGYGGSYQGAPVYPDYGHGEYRGYPDYQRHDDDDDRR